MRSFFYILSRIRAKMAARFWTLMAYSRLRAAGAEIGTGFYCSGPIKIHTHPSSRLSIGNNVIFNSGFSHNPCAGDRYLTIWVGPRGSLRIGNNVGVSNANVVAMFSVNIENFVYIGGGASILDSNFHSLDANERLLLGDRDVKTAAVTLGEKSFIGAYSIILKGVTVGSCSVVGAGSVVSRSIPPAQIWGGAPASCIRSLLPT